MCRLTKKYFSNQSDQDSLPDMFALISHTSAMAINMVGLLGAVFWNQGLILIYALIYILGVIVDLTEPEFTDMPTLYFIFLGLALLKVFFSLGFWNDLRLLNRPHTISYEHLQESNV